MRLYDAKTGDGRVIVIIAPSIKVARLTGYQDIRRRDAVALEFGRGVVSIRSFNVRVRKRGDES